jgi:hypothetical protein
LIAFLNKVNREVVDEPRRPDVQDMGGELERQPHPFVWTKTAEEILKRRLAGYCAAIHGDTTA